MGKTTMRAGLRRGRDQGGFALVELLVAILVLAIALGMATELYISSLHATSNIRQRTQMLDDADYVKSWLTQHLEVADVPPTYGDWQTLKVTSNSRCYSLSLDTDSHDLMSRSVDEVAQACPGLDDTAPVNVSQCGCVVNSSSDPLYVFLDKNGGPLDVNGNHSLVSQVATVEVHLTMKDATTNSTIPTQRRTLSYALGGAFYANQFPPGSIDTSQLVDGSVTNTKIAPGAITGEKFADGSIGLDKLAAAARAATTSFPLITDGRGDWSAVSTSSWTPGPNDAFARAGVGLGSYCVSGKTLEARGQWLVYNQTSSALSLRFKLVYDNGQGGGQNDYATSAIPAQPNVPGNGYGMVATPWMAVDCASPDPTVRYYSTQVLAADSGSTGKTFSVVSASLDLRYS
jgi:prepilin-type N-terminal cleavage/methylation domain-containing protein